jgi:maltooligosyltrehalose trehalohydrolase
LLLLAPHTPLLFMGQEYDEPAPFQFFSSYTDPALQEAVRKGRREEFKEFASSWSEVPDPEDPETFMRSKLHWELANAENEMLDWYSSLIALRKKYVLEHERTCRAETREGILRMQVPAERERATVLVFASLKRGQPLPKPLESGWEKVLEAEDESAAVAVWVR